MSLNEINDVKKAELKIHETFPKCRLVSVLEYNGLFVFNISDMAGSYRPLVAVEKKTGLVRAFNPLYDAREDYILAVKKSISYY